MRESSWRAIIAVAAMLVMLSGGAGPAAADEGMWPLGSLPLARLQQDYGFKPPEGWIDHLQASCVYMDASAAIVSADGLVMTNHHVGIDQVQQLSTDERNLLRDGFYAPTRDRELRCPGLEVKILRSFEDVTDRIRAAAPKDAEPSAAWGSMRAEMSRLEASEGKATGLECEVVPLYQGARFHLYRYERFDDVRLVMVPEEGAANFGGDTDNFEFPRYAYDICFFRLYRHGQPVRTPDHLRFTEAGIREGDLVFALGYPYRTSRLYTADQLRFARDVQLPANLAYCWRRESQLMAFSEREVENARVAETDLLEIQNWRKSEAGALEELLAPDFMRARQGDEDSLRAFVAADPVRAQAWGGAWDGARQALAAHREIFVRHSLFGEPGRVLGSDLFRYAQALVGIAEELPKPSDQRLEEFRDPRLPSLYHRINAPEPISDALEVDRLASGLSLWCERLGADDPLVSSLLAGLPPRERAAQLVAGCTLREPDGRRALMGEGAAGINASVDPMVRFATALLPVQRAARREYQDRVESRLQAAHEKIAAARFAWKGERVPPDATNTLRLSYGKVAGSEDLGAPVPAFTTVGGLFERAEAHGGQPPFVPAPTWTAARGRIDPATPFDFISTLDTVGGNSGSPIVNRDGDLVGLLFDGNMASCVWDFAYEETRARCIGLDARAILGALRNVYGAEALVKEITAP